MKARENPFRSEQVGRLAYRFAQGSMDQLFTALEQKKWRGAIVGPKGTGKTLLMDELQPRIAAAGYTVKRIRLDESHPTFSRRFLDDFAGQIRSGDVILFDGAEQMSAMVWMRFRWSVRRAGGMVITCHRPGRLPTLLKTRTSPQLLEDLVKQLAGPTAPDRAECERLFAAHHGNIRNALREFYDIYAAR